MQHTGEKSRHSGKSQQALRTEIYHEVLIWLEKQNAPAGRWSFLDRPFVLTVLGGLAIAGLSLWWQSADKARETELTYQRAMVNERLSLMKELGAVFQNDIATVSGMYQLVIFVGKEKNNTPPNQSRLSVLEEQERRLEERTMAPLDDVIQRVGIVYHCKSVRNAATKLKELWDHFLQTFNALSIEWNTKGSIENAELDAQEKVRNDTASTLNAQNDLLGHLMGIEVSGESTCAP